jgi:hypothetical protein
MDMPETRVIGRYCLYPGLTYDKLREKDGT